MDGRVGGSSGQSPFSPGMVPGWRGAAWAHVCCLPASTHVRIKRVHFPF